MLTSTKQQMLEAASSLWAKGLPLSQIAAALGTTRNAISGMSHRNRSLFPARKENKAPPEVDMKLASTMWGEGARIADIANKFGTSMYYIEGIMRRNRNIFPARNPGYQPPAPPSARGTKQPEWLPVKTKPYYGLDQYQIDGIVPVAFVDLSNSQCTFPLQATDEKAGPDMLCCGGERVAGRSFCAGHMKIVYTKSEEA